MPQESELVIEFSEACRTEIRRRVNRARKVGHLLIESASLLDIFNHDKHIILDFLQEEFHSLTGIFWQQAHLQDPWPTINDWSYPGQMRVSRPHADVSQYFTELIEPLYEKGFVFIFSHSGLYNAKMMTLQ